MMKSLFITRIKKSLITLLIICIGQNGIFSASVHASEPTSTPRESMSIAIGKSIVHKLTDPITRLSIGDSSIADVMLVNSKQIYILGKKSGSTNLNLWSGGSRVSVIDLAVGADTASLRNLLFDLLPNENTFRISAAGDSLVLSGKMSDAMRVQQAVKISEEFTGKKVLNMLVTEDLPQVLLEVKVAEIDKSIADRLGVQVSGSNFTFNPIGAIPSVGTTTLSGTIGSVTSLLQANMQSGLVKILAEPNIMAISGQEGKFLAGGIVFLPVPQTLGTGGTVITLQQQQFGVGIKFTPTVLSGGKINLKVAPEVSEVNPVGISISANNSTQILPAINTRQASTTVQLYDGQSFAIGGLIKNNVVEVISAFPWLANIPVLGALFRSSSFQNDRSELLIVVTPRIVAPLSSQPSLPTDKYIQPSQSEFFLEGRMEGRKPQGAPVNKLEQKNVQPVPIVPSQTQVPAVEILPSTPNPAQPKTVVRATPTSTLESIQAPAPTLAKPAAVVATSPSLEAPSVVTSQDSGVVSAPDEGSKLKALELPWREVEESGSFNSGAKQ
jgi:pilus assembly protein CpaC